MTWFSSLGLIRMGLPVLFARGGGVQVMCTQWRVKIQHYHTTTNNRNSPGDGTALLKGTAKREPLDNALPCFR